MRWDESDRKTRRSQADRKSQVQVEGALATAMLSAPGRVDGSVGAVGGRVMAAGYFPLIFDRFP
jgi:hypothetical protein